jgi:hypothetical protein
MSALDEFLQGLLWEGKAYLKNPPEPAPRIDKAVKILERGYVAYALDVAGPPVPFHPPTAMAAATLVQRACWYLVHREEAAAAITKHLAMPIEPIEPAQHLSADLVLRYLPLVRRRARAIAHDDVLTERLADVLRRWPLSGVLSDIREPPLTPLEFGGHPGLQLLYAERLAAHERPDWVPTGRTQEFVELVFSKKGKPPAEVS